MPQSSSLTWKQPQQARSRARVTAILDATAKLAIELGHLDFKMTSVAERARVPIGSLYQFFPTRTALLGQLFLREMTPIDVALRNGLEAATSVEDIVSGIGALIRANLDAVRSNPGLFILWTSPSLDPAIQAADLENSRRNAARIAERIEELDPASSRNGRAIEDTALLVCHLWGQVVRLCVLSEDDPTNKILDQYIEMVERHFAGLLDRA